MKRFFRVGDHVRWNSEAGRVSGTIIKRVTEDIMFKGYTHHASKDDPQYIIQSDKTDHQAIHKGTALRLIPRRKSSKVHERQRRARETRGSRSS